MKTLNLYVTRDFLATLLMSILVLTFAMLGAKMIKEVLELLTDGVPLLVVGEFMLYSLPMILSLTTPFSILVATMLVFGRMSADNEITAMRACGISVLQIVSPIIILTFLFTCVCLLLQIWIAPAYYGRAKNLGKRVFAEHPLAILKLNEDNEFGDYIINVADIQEDGSMRGIQLYEFNKTKDKLKKDVSALSGKIIVDKEKQQMRVILFKAHYEEFEEGQGTPRRSIMDRIEIPFDYGHEFNRQELTMRPKYMKLNHLFGRMLLEMRRGNDITYLLVEMNKRIAIGLSPLSFLLLGMPLAIRTSRRETSVGLFLSVILGGLFYFSIVLFEIINDPKIYPHILLWLPNILYQAGGTFFIWRIARR